MKFETEKYICTKNKTLDQFIKKWGTSCPKYVKITVFELFLKNDQQSTLVTKCKYIIPFDKFQL